MTEDYGCKVCGKHFEEEEDLKTHGKDDHPEVQEAYPDIFDKDAKVEEPKEAEEFDWDEIPEEEWDDVVLRKVNGEPEEEKPADEIDKQEDKPTQSHDDWLEDLKGLKDDFATEQEKCAICNGEHPTSEHPVTAQEEEEETVKVKKYWGDVSDDERDETVNVKKYWGKKEGEEEGGADEPLSKVDALSESYRFMSRDKRYSLFESLGFGQGDSAVLAGLEWNELTRPIKVEASEVYAKEEDVPAEKETGEDEEEEENKAYESLYNLEKYHSSPDYKKKNLICNRCNESFYNGRDRDVHFNEVHATGQEYELPDQCPFCKEIIQEPETLDWHMQEQHGAHVASQFTQTGVQGAMADTDFDSLESHKRAKEFFFTELFSKEGSKLHCNVCGNEFNSESDIINHLRDDHPDQVSQSESYAKEVTGDYWWGNHVKWESGMDQDFLYCNHCGQDLYVDASYHGDGSISDENVNEVVQTHMRNHGITESYAKEAKWECLDCDQEFDDAGKHQDETGHHNITKKKGVSESRATPGFDTNCTDGEPHEPPAEMRIGGTNLMDTTCVKCGKTINQTGEGSGYWFTPEDHVEWDRAINNLDEYGNVIRESYAHESRATDLKKEIREQKEYINMASFENPMNMGDAEDKLHNLESELESLGGEELEGTEEEGQEGEGDDVNLDDYWDEDSKGNLVPSKKQSDYKKNITDSVHGWEGEGGHQDLDDTTQYPDDPEDPEEEQEKVEEGGPGSGRTPEDFDKQLDDQYPNRVKDDTIDKDEEEFMAKDWANPPTDEQWEQFDKDRKNKKSTEYVDDSDNAGEKYICEDCDKEFSNDTALQEHQFSYYHGDYKGDNDGATSPRNVMGGM